MLSVHGEATHRGETPFLLNVNHNGAQFFCNFSQVTMTNVVFKTASRHYTERNVFSIFSHVITCIIFVVVVAKASHSGK
jgi:hypothetical protein